jgi:hypothetical protein
MPRASPASERRTSTAASHELAPCPIRRSLYDSEMRLVLRFLVVYARDQSI